MKFFDSHAHYNNAKFDTDREELFEKMHQMGIDKILNAGYDIESSLRAIELAEKYAFVYASVGMAPHATRSSQYGAVKGNTKLSKT